MKRRFPKLIAMTMVLTLISTLAALPALADNRTPTFTQFLIVEENASIPNFTFEYAIAVGEAVDAENGKPAILAGIVDSSNPTIGNAKFTNTTPTYSAVQSGDALTLASGEKYGKATVTMDFTNVVFTQPGIYRYVITATTSDAHKSVSYDIQNTGTGTTPRTRYLDAYVIYDDTSGDLVVDSYVMHTTTGIETSAANDKSSGFVNSYNPHDLTFGKEVTGNQGSKDKYFKFTLAIGGAQPNATVDLSKAESSPVKNSSTSYDSMQNSANLQTGADGDGSWDFYLKDGQYITVRGLPDGYSHTLSEIAEDYTSTAGITASNNAGNDAHSDPVSNTTGVSADVKTGFTNSRNGVIPTGILLTIAPFAIGLLVFGAIMVFMMARKRRSDDED